MLVIKLHWNPLCIDDIAVSCCHSCYFFSCSPLLFLLVYRFDLTHFSFAINVCKTWPDLLKPTNRRQYKLVIFQHSNGVVCLHVKFNTRKCTVNALATRINWSRFHRVFRDPVITCVFIVIIVFRKLIVESQRVWLFHDRLVCLGRVFRLDTELNRR